MPDAPSCSNCRSAALSEIYVRCLSGTAALLLRGLLQSIACMSLDGHAGGGPSCQQCVQRFGRSPWLAPHVVHNQRVCCPVRRRTRRWWALAARWPFLRRARRSGARRGRGGQCSRDYQPWGGRRRAWSVAGTLTRRTTLPDLAPGNWQAPHATLHASVCCSHMCSRSNAGLAASELHDACRAAWGACAGLLGKTLPTRSVDALLQVNMCRLEGHLADAHRQAQRLIWQQGRLGASRGKDWSRAAWPTASSALGEPGSRVRAHLHARKRIHSWQVCCDLWRDGREQSSHYSCSGPASCP